VAIVYVLCGFIGSGKTTFAKRIEAETGAVRFTMDEWIIPLFGEHMSREQMDYRIAFFEARFKALAIQFVRHGADVILDSGYWKRSSRHEICDWARSIGADVRKVHFSTSLEECRVRTLTRTNAGDHDVYKIDGTMFDVLAALYEPPEADEPFDEIIE
jgi:predicted kinase